MPIGEPQPFFRQPFQLSQERQIVYEEHRSLLEAMQVTAERLKMKLSEIPFNQFLKTAYHSPQLNSFFLKGITQASDPDATYRTLWTTDAPEVVFPFHRMFHVTSSLALDHLVEGKPLLPSKILRDNHIATHKGDIFHFIDDFFKQVIDIGMGEKERFVWVGSEADPQDFFLIQEAGKLPSQKRVEQIQTFARHLNNLLAVPPDNLQRLSEAVNNFSQCLFDISGIREGWYLKIKKQLSQLLKQEKGRRLIELFALHLEKQLKAERHHNLSDRNPEGSFYPIVLEIDMAQAFQLSSVNGVNLVAIRRGAGSARIASLPVIHPRAIRAIYSDQEIPNEVCSAFQCLPTHSLDNGHWLQKQPPHTITSVDPSAALCDTRYSQLLPVQDLINAGALTPLISYPYTNSYSNRDIPIPFLQELAATSTPIGNLDNTSDLFLVTLINELHIPGLYDYTECLK